MSLSLSMQYLLIALAVIASLIVVMRKQFPKATRRLRITLALPMLRDSAPASLKKLGRWIAPEPISSSGSGKDCGGCNSC